jgi:hypothetical protein
LRNRFVVVGKPLERGNHLKGLFYGHLPAFAIFAMAEAARPFFFAVAGPVDE